LIDGDVEVVHSALQQRLRSKRQTVEISIYKFVHDAEWVLEVVAADGTSTVWDDKFANDRDALEEAKRAIAAEALPRS